MPREKYDALKIETRGRDAEARLMSALKQSDIFSMCYAYKSRVKPEAKLLEKKARKLEKKPDYKLHHITDVIGIRLVTLFRDEMPKVFEKLSELILHKDSLNPNPFKKYHVEEVITYTTNQYDDIQAKIKEIFDSRKIPGKFESHVSKEGYSSIHVVTRLNEDISDLSCTTESYHIPVEIQIRTVFEDAWGEIDHKYGYVIREGKETGTPIANPQSVLKHLKILKKFSDACGEYADAIHSEAVPVQAIDVAQVVSVFADEEILEIFESFGIPTKHIEKYKIAREQRLDGQREREKNISRHVATFLEAAQQFRELAEEYAGAHAVGSKEYVFFFYLKMSEAIALLSTNQKDMLQAALGIYQMLDTIYTDYPLLKLRYGQCLGKLGLVDLSVEMYKQAHQAKSAFEDNGLKFSEKLPKADYEHMQKFLPRLFGYQLWKKYRTIPCDSADEIAIKCSLMEEAYNVTLEAIPFEQGFGLAKVHNNLLYYGLQYVQLSDGHSLQSEFTPDLRAHLSAILSNINIDETVDIELLDTVAQAYDYLNDSENITKIVDKIIAIALDPKQSGSCDRDITLEIAQDAFAMRKKYLPAASAVVDKQEI